MHKVSSKAQRMADEYIANRENPTEDFEIYANGRFYTFSIKNCRGYLTAKFEHYGKRFG